MHRALFQQFLEETYPGGIMNSVWKKRAMLITFFLVLAIIVWCLMKGGGQQNKGANTTMSTQKLEITVKVVGGDCVCGHNHTMVHKNSAAPKPRALPPLPEIKKVSQSSPPSVEVKTEPQVIIIERTRTRVIHEDEPVENEYQQRRPRRAVYDNYGGNDGGCSTPAPQYYYNPPQYYYYPPQYSYYSGMPQVWGGGGRVWNSSRQYGGGYRGGGYRGGGPQNPPIGGGYRGGGGGPQSPPVGGRMSGGSRSAGHR